MPLPFCVCSDGASMRQLPLLSISVSLIRVATMRPPRVGAELSVTLFPQAGPPVGPMSCRVVAADLHPGDAKSCSFDLLPLARREQRAELDTLIEGLPATEFLWGGRRAMVQEVGAGLGSAPFERRAAPRVTTDLAARLFLSKEVLIAKVVDLSMSGAQIELAEETHAEIAFAHRVELELPEPGGGRVQLEARVVRMAGWHGVRRIAVCFDALDGTGSLRLERILLWALCGM